MRGMRFSVEGRPLMGISDVAPVDDDDDLVEVLVEGVYDTLGTEVWVRVSGVTMFLAAWQDPDHWSSDWAEVLGIDADDVPSAVRELLANAVEERG